MILLAILAGIVAVFVWKRHTTYTELVILISFGLLAAGTPLGATPAHWLMSLSNVVQGWF